MSVPGKKTPRRAYTRRADHDEIRRRYAEGGVTQLELAIEYGYTPSWIWYILHPEQQDKLQATANARRWPCIDCGKPAKRKGGRCRACWAGSTVTTVREDTLRCTTCKQWKPDKKFPMGTSSPLRRGRHQQCTSCQTKTRAAWRERNRERERANDRARYYAKKKAA